MSEIREEGSSIGTSLVVYLLGVAVGATVAILYAPAAGTETRAQLADKAGQLKDKAVELKGQVVEKAGEIKTQVSQKATELREKASDLIARGETRAAAVVPGDGSDSAAV
jgi:gas vesicle protein